MANGTFRIIPLPGLLILAPVFILLIIAFLPLILLFLIIGAIFGGRPVMSFPFRDLYRKPEGEEEKRCPASECTVEAEVISARTVDEDGNELPPG